MKQEPRLKHSAKKPPSKLQHEVISAPVNTMSVAAHREIRKYEDDNVGLEAAHRVEGSAESGVRLTASALRSRRKSAPPERKPEKVNSVRKDPMTSNPASREQQKRAIRKQYAAAKTGKTTEATKKTATATAKAAEKVKEAGKKTAEFIRRHKKGFLIAGGIALVLAFLLSIFSSCSAMLESMGTAVTGSTYPSKDEDMLGAEAAYGEMEDELREYLETYESTHDYDEYHFDLDEIEHDPYVLISILTAWKQGEWTLDEVRGMLDFLFDKQYELTEEVETETRYRTETRTGSRTVRNPETGETYVVEVEYEVEVPYEYTICYVTLRNFNLAHVPVYILDEEQLSMYSVYMATLGNRTDLFPASEYIARYSAGITGIDFPTEVMADEQFAAIITEAEKYLGYPFVWGGSSPNTSFDCSGFVSWVINHSGWDVGRLGVDGLYGICTPVSASEAKPGDLVFFQGTYDTPGFSHVGIYVGNDTMIHCGDPISYTNLNSSYWQAHFAGFGRLP